jgi:uncharacterized membrane protein
VGLLDKFFCEKRFKNTYAFATTVNLLSLIFIFGLSFLTDFSFKLGWPLFFALVSGPVYFLMWFLWWKALRSGEVSRLTAIFQTSPIFNALLAVIFLGENLRGFKWLAIFLIVAGAIVCSWEKSKTTNGFNKIYLLVILSALIGAVGNLISKIALREINPFAIYALSYYVSLPLFLGFLTKREVLEEIRENLKEKRIFLILFLRSFLAFLAICFFYLALSSGPLSLIAAVNGSGPLFVFLYSTSLSIFWPRIIKEELSHQVLFSKALAIILIVSGVVLINF